MNDQTPSRRWTTPKRTPPERSPAPAQSPQTLPPLDEAAITAQLSSDCAASSPS